MATVDQPHGVQISVPDTIEIREHHPSAPWACRCITYRPQRANEDAGAAIGLAAVLALTLVLIRRRAPGPLPASPNRQPSPSTPSRSGDRAFRARGAGARTSPASEMPRPDAPDAPTDAVLSERARTG